MKGIILAGGKATRLYPITKAVCKQLLPLYDKPMIYYPLSVLMLAGIREILIISTPQDLPRFKDLFGTGRELGISLCYAAQAKPRGIAESFIIGRDFIGRDNVALILGDNIFYGNEMVGELKEAAALKKGALVFGYYVKEPQRYGVMGFGRREELISIEEKPKAPKSNWVVTGLYFCDRQAVEIARKLEPSKRGEIEITDLLSAYLRKHELKVKLLGRGFAWLDTGTPDSLIDASMFIRTVEERQGLKIGCIEEIAFRMGYISSRQLENIALGMPKGYAEYLRQVARG
jgi:glucose-1-phosphate thymidylyltransferase